MKATGFLNKLVEIASSTPSDDRDILILMILEKYFEGQLSSQEIVPFLPFLNGYLQRCQPSVRHTVQSLIALDPSLDG